jgi:hypothetical protein
MEDKYFEWSTYEPRSLMRRTADFQDQIFVDGIWRDTDRILGYMLKGDFGVDPIDTQSAKEKYPEAFN